MRVAFQIMLGFLGGLLGYFIGSFLGLYTFLGAPYAIFFSACTVPLEVPMAIILYIALRKRAYITLLMSFIPVVVGYLTCGWLIYAYAVWLASEI